MNCGLCEKSIAHGTVNTMVGPKILCEDCAATWIKNLVVMFHEKQNLPYDVASQHIMDADTRKLLVFVRSYLNAMLNNQLRYISTVEGSDDNVYLQRIKLMASELCEWVDAILDEPTGAGQMLELTDLLYTVVGTFVTFGWPMEWLFAEVHRSNMTKGPRCAKGDSYEAPDFRRIT